MSLRITPRESPYPERMAQTLDRIMPKGVPPIMLFRVMARDERLFERFMGGTLLDKGHLTLRERELVILRVCANNESEYEWGVHVSGFAQAAGFDTKQLAATVHEPARARCWTTRERALVELCDALQETCALSDAQFQELRAEFSEDALLELLMLVGKYRTVSILTNALRLPLEAWAARFPPRN